MRDDPVEYRVLATARTKEPRFVVNVEFPTGSLYITSHPDITGVPGSVLEACLADPTVTSQRLNPDEGRAEIGSASFRIVDRGSQFTTQIRSQLANGNGLRRRKVRFYKGFKGQGFAEFQLYATQIVSGAEYDKGSYSVQCSDVQRSARKEICAPVTTTLAASISATDATIPVASTAGFARVFHGPSYSDAPSQTVGYIRIKDEWIRYTGTTGTTFTGCTRGVFGTIAAAYTVDAETPAARREKVTEGIYLEIPGPKALYAILTGILYGDGAQLPSHWHLGIDPSLVRIADFVGIGTDFWDTSDDTRGFVPRFLGIQKTDGKKFYEEQLLRAMGMFAPVYADGSLGLRKMASVLADAGTVATLDESNCVQVGALEHDMDSLRNVFTAQWNPSADGKSFTREFTLLDAFSVATHGRGEEIKLAFQGLWGGRHTDSTLFRLIDALRDRYAAPPQRISVDVFSSLDAIEVGDVVRLKLQHVRDFAGNVVGIDRAFEVQGTSVNHRTGRVTLQLFGSTAPASALAPTQNVTSLPDAFYNSAGTNLTSIATITGGVMAAGTYTLTGSADLNAAPSIYYFLGDLTIPSTVTLNIVGNVQLRVRGYYTQNGAIVGVGQGKPGVADAAGPTQPVGNPGFVGNSRGWDGIDVARDYEDGPPDMTTMPARLTRAAHATFPPLLLEVVGSTLRGLPTDLRGTGGAPGGRIVTGGSSIRSLGGAGAAGGAGLCVISRGFGLGASASINLSGNSSAPTTVLMPDRNTYAAGPGGAGGPGALLVLLDGSLLSVPDFTGKFVANTGAVTLPSGSLPPVGEIKFLDNEGRHRYPSNTGVWMGYNSPDVISSRSLAVAALRVQFVPAPETASQDADSRPPPLTGLSATAQVGGIAIEATVPDWSLFDVVEIFASVDDQLINASKVGEIRGTRFVHPLPGGAQRWYWGRTRKGQTIFNTPNVSTFLPSTATSTITATASAAGTGPAGDSLFVQYSGDASTWHDPPFVAGSDIYMRQRVGTSGSWSPAIRIVGENGTPGAAGGTGNFIDFIFRRAATQPSTPTGSSPAGWSDAPPAADGNPCWMSSAEKTAAGALVGGWSTPVRFDGVDGAGAFSLVLVNAAKEGARITGAGSGSWGASQAYSVQGYPACYVAAKAGIVSQSTMFGLNTDPATDASYTSLDYAFYLANGGLEIYENGNQVLTGLTYDLATTLSIVYDGVRVRYYRNGVLVRTAPNPGRTFYFDSAFATAGGVLDFVAFGPAALATSPGLTLVPRNSGAAVMAAVANAVHKIGNTGSWEGDAYSLESYVGPCEVTFRVHRLTPGGLHTASAAYLMGGLTTDPLASAEYSTIDYALFTYPGDATVRVYQNGSERFQYNYAWDAETLFGIRYTGSAVEYRVNGTLIYTTPAPPGLRLYFDSAFADVGSQILDISFGPIGNPGAPAFTLVPRGSSLVSGTTIAKSGGGAAAYDSDVYSLESWVGGAFVSFRAGQTNAGGVLGLNSDPLTDQSFSSIDYSWNPASDGIAYVYAGASYLAASTPYTTSDVLAVHYDGKQVRWLKNGVQIQAIAAAANQRLYFDCSIYSPGARFTDIAFGPAGTSGNDGANGSNGVSPVQVVLVPEAWQVPCDYLGAVKSGALPKSIAVSVKQAGADIGPSSVSLSPSGCSVGAYSGGFFTITAVAAETAYVDVSVTAAGQTIVKRLSLSKVVDAQPLASARATLSNTNTNVGSSLYPSSGPSVTLTAPASGTINVSSSFVHNCNTAGDGTVQLQAKIQWRPSGGSWADVSGATGTSSPSASNIAGEIEPGVCTISSTALSGLTPGASYEFQYLQRKSGGTASTSGGSGAMTVGQA
jgi:hypothetical protein